MKLGYAVTFKEFTVQNMVASCSVNFPIRLEGLAVRFDIFCNYEPEVFPGLVFRMRNPTVVLLIFVTGKIVITGAKKVEQIYQAFDNVYAVLQDFRKDDARRIVRAPLSVAGTAGPAPALPAPAGATLQHAGIGSITVGIPQELIQVRHQGHGLPTLRVPCCAPGCPQSYQRNTHSLRFSSLTWTCMHAGCYWARSAASARSHDAASSDACFWWSSASDRARRQHPSSHSCSSANNSSSYPGVRPVKHDVWLHFCSTTNAWDVSASASADVRPATAW
jgi:Transcription factor TFIID (or TATA-binding protein, TBP)